MLFQKTKIEFINEVLRRILFPSSQLKLPQSSTFVQSGHSRLRTLFFLRAFRLSFSLTVLLTNPKHGRSPSSPAAGPSAPATIPATLLLHFLRPRRPQLLHAGNEPYDDRRRHIELESEAWRFIPAWRCPCRDRDGQSYNGCMDIIRIPTSPHADQQFRSRLKKPV